MSFCRFPVSAFAAFAFAGVVMAQAPESKEAADDNKPAVEAIPAAEKEKMDAECAFIKALIEWNMPFIKNFTPLAIWQNLPIFN